MNKPPNIGTQFSPQLPSFELDHSRQMKGTSLGPKYLIMARSGNTSNTENLSTINQTLTNVSPFHIKKK